MIEQNVQVVRCLENRMWVRMGSQSGCTACDNGNGCGAGVFAKLLQNKPVIMELERNDAKIQTGQMLTLGFPDQVYLKLVFGYYGWPLLAALGGAFVFWRLGDWAVLGAGWLDLATLAGGLLGGTLALRTLKNRQNMNAVLNSLQTTVYIPSVNPNMCNSELNQHIN